MDLDAAIHVRTTLMIQQKQAAQLVTSFQFIITPILKHKEQEWTLKRLKNTE